MLKHLVKVRAIAIKYNIFSFNSTHFHIHALMFPIFFSIVATDEFLRETLVEKRTAVEAQGNVVRALKVAKTPKPEIIAAIEALNALKLEKTSIEHSFLNELDTLELCLFSIPSFKI
ncbi:hypothetical protein AAZX31_07G189900 [Glycine max]|nr:hypothetical protein GLYMA_07G206033v4 [Glycine max]KAH1087790.1 hypothetical protein GYH30_019055 [Glycine max]